MTLLIRSVHIYCRVWGFPNELRSLSVTYRFFTAPANKSCKIQKKQTRKSDLLLHFFTLFSCYLDRFLDRFLNLLTLLVRNFPCPNRNCKQLSYPCVQHIFNCCQMFFRQIQLRMPLKFEPNHAPKLFFLLRAHHRFAHFLKGNIVRI